MGRGVQEEDSSSPSDNLKLVQAERTGTGGERIKLQFSDGSCFFVFDSDLREQGISAAQLTPALQLPAAVIQRLKQSALIRQIREKALDLLGRAPHTTFSLRIKLLKRGFESRAVGEVLQFLEREGYLDDGVFAENWVRGRIERRPEGRAVLVAALRRKGVSREIAEGAVNRYLTPALERENAARALDRLKRSGENDPAALQRKLRARGFSFPLIRRVMDGGE
jgi:SOS response regulatory protein OraA/RecX